MTAERRSVWVTPSHLFSGWEESGQSNGVYSRSVNDKVTRASMPNRKNTAFAKKRTQPLGESFWVDGP